MSYSGAQTARSARENLGRALAALQEDPNIPPDVLAVAQNIAQAVGALFDAERAPGEPEGKAAVKRALGVVGQTLALLQDVRGQHRGVQMATESIAQSMSVLYPLTTVPSLRPQAPNAPIMGQPSPMSAQFGQSPPPQQGYGQPPQPAFAPTQQAYVPPQQAYVPPQPAYAPPQPAYVPPQQAPLPPPAPAIAAAFSATTVKSGGPPQMTAQPARMPSAAPVSSAQSGYRGAPVDRKDTEVNIGATTESNFFVGFSGEISEGGVFCATYTIFPKGTPIRLLVTLPGNFEKHVNGFVRFVRDPMDLTADSEPGMGVQFEGLDPEARELILRFIRKRPPMFYDE